MGVHEVETRLPLPFMFFCPELENGISKFFTNLKKKKFSKKITFSSRTMHESISSNWHLFRITNLTYDEMWKRRMYLASEIIFEFLLAYFILFCDHFRPKHHFGFDIFFKSLKQARNIVPLSHFVSKGLTKLDFARL